MTKQILFTVPNISQTQQSLKKSSGTKTMFLRNEWSGGVVIKIWTINPEVRGSLSCLARTFLGHFVFPIQLERKWFETQK